tara:strand:- start:1782 stop:1925 length:144 start_codon:yes stop_codon:yes gene_type:complete
MGYLTVREVLIEFVIQNIDSFTDDELEYFVDYIVTKDIDLRKDKDLN